MVGVLLPSADLDLLERAEAKAFERFWGKNMSELQKISPQEVREFAGEFRELLYSMPFQIPQNIIFLGRAVGILSGMCTGLDPQFNVWDHLAPYAQKLIADEAKNNGEFWVDELKVLARSFLSVPVKMDSILAKLERGDISVRSPEILHQVSRLEGAIRQVTGAILFAALLLGGIELSIAGHELPGNILFGGAALSLLWTIFAGRQKG
jgi:predicted unusual protein kinase regulating ubiquinone biosynthesis (AarF/ABC1/UbiB family)